MILKYMTTDELETRVFDLQALIDKTEARLKNPPAHATYNRRLELATAADLHKYQEEVKAELVRREAKNDWGQASPGYSA